MPGRLKYITFSTDMGWVGILSSAKGLLGTTLPQPSIDEVRQLLDDSISHATWSPHLFNRGEKSCSYLTFPFDTKSGE